MQENPKERFGALLTPVVQGEAPGAKGERTSPGKPAGHKPTGKEW
jgi:hypothetical protein